jgi:hypothetical protein
MQQLQWAEALHEGVIPDVGQVLEAPSAHDQQAHQQPNHRGYSEVPAEPPALEAATSHGTAVHPVPIPGEKFPILVKTSASLRQNPE